MKSILTVLKKDLKRYFTDKRIIIGLIMPGIMIFLMYTFMGDILTENLAPTDYEYTVYAENVPQELSPIFSPEGMKITVKAASETGETQIKEELTNGDAELYIVFDEDFMRKITEYDASSGEAAPQVKIYYSSSSMQSTSIYSYFTSALNAFEDSLTNRFDIPAGDEYNLGTKEGESTMFISMIMPMMLMMLLWSGCMMISSEAIAGEKERGTMATLLVTPVKRGYFALGKVLSLSITALLSALCSFAGVIASLPKLFAGAEVTTAIYGAGTYIALLAVIILTVLLYNIILLIISTYAKSVKEAASLSTAAMIPVLLIGILCMFGDAAANPLVYLIPVYNSAQCFTALLSLTFSPLNFIITIVANAVYVGLGVFALTKMFGSEKIMFGR